MPQALAFPLCVMVTEVTFTYYFVNFYIVYMQTQLSYLTWVPIIACKNAIICCLTHELIEADNQTYVFIFFSSRMAQICHSSPCTYCGKNHLYLIFIFDLAEQNTDFWWMENCACEGLQRPIGCYSDRCTWDMDRCAFIFDFSFS